MKKTVMIVTAILALAGLIYFLLPFLFRVPQAQHPTSMPPVVKESMDALLQSLEGELRIHRPDTLPFLQTGISNQQLEQTQASLGMSIHPEMQALYRWHNGLANDMELFPGHGFWPLEQAIRTNRELNEQYRERGFSLLMAPEEHWLILFPDGAGDGYYYDPVQTYGTGGVFYNFREARYYLNFPSVKNLLKAIVECYQQGAYLPNGETDFEIEDRILNKYGIANEGQ
jgi:hypothetical protein